jgi:hypothetical protein
MPAPRTFRQDFWQGTDPGMMLFRVTGPNRIPLQSADVTLFLLEVFDMSVSPKQKVASISGPGSQIVFDTLQKNDGFWSKDDIGYDVRVYLSASDFTVPPQGEHTYRTELELTTGDVSNRSGAATVPARWGKLVGVVEGTCLPRETAQLASGGSSADFSITVSPSSATANLGDNLSFTVSIGASNGFSSPVALSAAPAISGITYSFDTNPLSPNSSTTMHVSVSGSASGGNNTILVTGTAGTLTHSTQIQLSIAQPDFSLSTDILSAAIAVGATQDILVTVSAASGFSGSVALTATAFPAMTGASFTFDSPSVTPTASTTLHVTNTGSVPINLYSLTINGTQGTLSHNAYVNFQVGTRPANGYTAFTVSSDTRIIYLSTSGVDTNDGLSQLTPKRSIVSASQLLRSGFPDWFLFKKGDAFDITGNDNFGIWTRSGRSISEPMLLGAYGSGTTRPLLRIHKATGQSGEAIGLYHDVAHVGADHVSIVGLEWWADQHSQQQGQPVAIMWFGASQNLLIEDCRVREFSVGIIVQGTFESGPHHANFKLRRNVIHDCWNSDPSTSHGVYSDFIDGWLVEGNVFDRNGYGFSGPLSGFALQQAHNIYINNGATGVIGIDNVFAQTSGFDTARPGGIFKNNLMARVAVAMRCGHHGIGDVSPPAGITVEIRGNVILDGNDFSTVTSDARGWGISLENVVGGLVDGNIIAHNRFGHGATPIQFRLNDSTGRILENCIISNNVVYDWQSLPYPPAPPDPTTSIAIEADTAGVGSFFGNKLRNNIIMEPRVGGNGADTIVSANISTDILPANFTGYGNKYFSMRGGNGDFSNDAFTLGWFNAGPPPSGGNSYTVNTFRAAMGDPESGHAASIPELHIFPAGTTTPGGSAALDAVDLEHYMTSISLPNTLAYFLNGDSVRNADGTISGTIGARMQSRDRGYFDTETRFTSTAVNNYIRAGFGVTYTP